MAFWMILFLVTGIPNLGILWWVATLLNQQRQPTSGVWLEDDSEDWRLNAAGLGGKRG